MSRLRATACAAFGQVIEVGLQGHIHFHPDSDHDRTVLQYVAKGRKGSFDYLGRVAFRVNDRRALNGISLTPRVVRWESGKHAKPGKPSRMDCAAERRRQRNPRTMAAESSRPGGYGAFDQGLSCSSEISLLV
jgi:hypothetical protein